MVFHRFDFTGVHEELLKLVEIEAFVTVEVVVLYYVQSFFERDLGALARVSNPLLTFGALLVHLLEVVLVLQLEQLVHHIAQAVRVDPLFVSVEDFVHLDDLLIVFGLRHDVGHDDLELIKIDFLVFALLFVPRKDQLHLLVRGLLPKAAQ